jgi:hypothetical protein
MRSTKVILPEQKPYTHQGRVQKLFGTYIPPKKVPAAKKYLTLRFCLNGLIPSKKNDYYSENNYRQIMNLAFTKENPKLWLKENLRSWIRGSKRYLEWLETIDAEMKLQMDFWSKKYDLVFPLQFVSIKTYYFFADSTARDLISKDESVYDMLVSKSVIQDDNYGVLHKTSSDGGCYKGEINDHICTVDVTLALF